MRLLHKLLGRLYRAMVIDPDAFLAMRISHPAGGAWSVAEGVLTVQPLTDPLPAPTTFVLFEHTLRSLAIALANAGWTIDDLSIDQRDRGALCLLPGGDAAITAATGRLLAHNNPIWPLMDAFALELAVAGAAADATPKQLSTRSAGDMWLDEIGGYYEVARLVGEPDVLYGPRIPAEVVRPKTNNFAMAAILRETTGQAARVIDVTIYGPEVPIYDGSIEHDGTYQHDSSALPIYGLFDVITGFDLEGADSNLAGLVAKITGQVERLRAGGYLLRQVLIEGGNLDDTAPGPGPDPSDSESLGLAMVLDLTETSAPTDAAPSALADLSLTEAAATPDDATTGIDASFTHILNGAWRLDGSRPLSSGAVLPITF